MANNPQDPTKLPGVGLTEAQLRELQRAMAALDPQPQPAPQTLSESQITSLKAEAEKYRTAQRQVTDALGVLWNAQLDMAINLGQSANIEDSLTGMRRFYDNCSCGGTGGAGAW